MKEHTRIAAGATAEVFQWDENRILKLFLAGYPEQAVRREYENARITADYAFAKPAVYGIVEQDGRSGILYEYVRGENLLEQILRTGEPDLIRQMAELHRKVLACPGDGLVDYRDRLSDAIQYASWLSEDARRDALAACRALPEGNALCHGDLHPGNILLSNGQPVLIDFQDLCRGPALYDIARTVFLMECTPIPTGMPEQEAAAQAQLRRACTEGYLAFMGVRREELTPYFGPIVASRSDVPHENA